MIKPKLVATITLNLSRIGLNSSHEIILRYTTMFENMSRRFFMFAHETQKIWLVSSQNNSSSVIRTRCIATLPHTYYINGNSEQEKIPPHQLNCLLSKMQVTMCLQYIVTMCAAKKMLKPHCIISQNAKSGSQLVRLTFGAQKHSIMLYFLRPRIPSGRPIWSSSV